MKGISTVIATIIMLVITIALAGIAYMYMSSALTTRASKMISLVDASCDAGGNVYATVKNTDPYVDLTSTDVVARIDGTPVNCGWTSGTMARNGGTDVCTIAGVAVGAHRVRIVGPSNAEESGVYC